MDSKDLQVSLSIKATDTPDGVVLLDVQGGMCFPLDQVGTFIWKGLANGLRIDDIARQISTNYQISHEQASLDVQDFVQQLQEKHLLVEGLYAEHPRPISWIASLGTFCKRLRRSTARGT
jgi:hypothetical protein